MPTRLLCLAILLLTFLPACAPAEACQTSSDGTPLNILFIGNSYTYANDLPATFTHLACAGGYKVQAAMAAEGGYTLQNHLASDATQQKLKEQKWDYVVLQEQSEIPAIPASRAAIMYPAARALVAQIRASNAQPVFFMTWGHRDGAPDFGLPSFGAMQLQLYTGYLALAQELDVPVALVGSAWVLVRNQPDPVDLWQADGSHPNEKGTYLAACVFYATLFHQTPLGLSFNAGLDKDSAALLQSFAAQAVLGKK